MRTRVTLITGANGEIGHGLIAYLRAQPGDREILALDLNPLDPKLVGDGVSAIVGNILDRELLERLRAEFEIVEIYHLAALLSTRAEIAPLQAHHVNVDGTLGLLQLAHDEAQWHGSSVKFLFPSSIAAYGMPSRSVKTEAGRVRETDFNFPTTMYGCNKLYCEHLGRYYTMHFRQLAKEARTHGVDFRSIRFPGLISAVTVPSGGTSDYAPEMIHYAARGEPYACFVDSGAALPFMAMPDAIRSLTMLAEAPADALSQRVYNVTAFSVTAGELRERVLREFPAAELTFEPDDARAGIVDSWPADVDDGPARRDWGWQPEFDYERALNDYVLPNVRKFYEAR